MRLAPLHVRAVEACEQNREECFGIADGGSGGVASQGTNAAAKGAFLGVLSGGAKVGAEGVAVGGSEFCSLAVCSAR